MLRRFFKCSRVIKRNVSALYVTGDKATENFAILTPFLEIDEKMKNLREIQENIERRRLTMNVNDLKSEYELYAAVEKRKKELEDRRQEIVAQMKKDGNEGLRVQGRNVKEDLRKLKENSYHLEDQFVHNFLRIPNDIHHKTPKEKTVLYNFLDKPAQEQQPNEASVHELIEYYDPTCYYMKGDAARFDLETALNVCDLYSENGNFIKFSNPDFVRSIIPEAAGVDMKNVFLLKEVDIENKLNLLHLTGNGSMLSYLPFIAKFLTFPTHFPLKLISTGKIYNNENHFDHQSLYDVVQTTCCQVFIATCDSSSFDETIEAQIDYWKRIFEPFEQHFRIVGYPAHELMSSESYKIGIEMFSVCQNEYVEVGNFSYHSDFISKRLLFNYKQDKDTKFPHIYSGTVVNVMKLLVNLVENNCNIGKFVEKN